MPDALGRVRWYATCDGGRTAFSVHAATRHDAHAEAVAAVLNPPGWRIVPDEWARAAAAKKVRILTPAQWAAVCGGAPLPKED